MLDFGVETARKVDISTDLFEGSNPLGFVEGKVFDRSQKPSRRSGNENHRVNCVFEMALFHVGNLSFFRDGFSLDFQHL